MTKETPKDILCNMIAQLSLLQNRTTKSLFFEINLNWMKRNEKYAKCAGRFEMQFCLWKVLHSKTKS